MAERRALAPQVTRPAEDGFSVSQEEEHRVQHHEQQEEEARGSARCMGQLGDEKAARDSSAGQLQVWLFSGSMGNPAAEMSDPQSRMQGKIIVK